MRVMSCARVLAGVLLAAIFLLTACGAESAEGIEDDNLRPVTTTLNDGRQVECIVFQSINEGGIWCALAEGG